MSTAPFRLSDGPGPVGREIVAILLASFAGEAERRLGLIESPGAKVSEPARQAHAPVSLVGQLGLDEVSGLCRGLEEAARGGTALPPFAELRAAVRRALDAVASSSYARAA